MQQDRTPTRIVGIDYGLARIGIAISDERKIIARPVHTLLAEKKLEQTVDKLLSVLQEEIKKQHFRIAEIVIGLPLHMSGRRGVLADEVIHFADIIKQKSSLPVQLWDERLTSVQAERSMLEANLSRKKRSTLIDTVAAVLILQSYLDSLSQVNDI